MTIMASMSRRLFLFLIRKTLRPGPARAESATPAAGPGEHLNEFPNGNDSMQRQHCHSEEIGRATKNLYKSIRRQILDCTSFVFLLLARHSPQAAFGSQGKRFFTSFRMTKAWIRTQPAGHARRQPDVCGPALAKAAAIFHKTTSQLSVARLALRATGPSRATKKFNKHTFRQLPLPPIPHATPASV